jgi:hypothetical protein
MTKPPTDAEVEILYRAARAAGDAYEITCAASDAGCTTSFAARDARDASRAAWAAYARAARLHI